MAVFENPLIDSIDFFTDQDTVNPSYFNHLGDGFSKRIYKGTFQKFPFMAATGDTISVYFLVRNTEQMVLPISVSSNVDAIQNNNVRDLIYGAFMGVILVMLFYNLFVFASTRDTNYLYYVLYIFFIGLGQISLSGHIFSLLIRDLPVLYKCFIVVLPALSGVFAVLFIKKFLQAKSNAPKLNSVLTFVAILYGSAGLVRIFGYYQFSARMMDVMGLPAAIIVFVLAFRVYNQGFKSAIYFIVAWSIFIFGVVMFVFRNLGFLPFNAITSYTLPMGAAIEVALLSFALADKINTLQAEKREKEREVLMAALENERLIKEQNVILEHKVQERTLDLAKSNNQLSTAIHELKSTQSQMVEQEKMASLGQLTAGIAHEINNPINFVTGNISPLKRDIKLVQELLVNVEGLATNGSLEEINRRQIDKWKSEIDFDYLQEEMDFLLKGIDDGAHRTSEIVKGLRIFAHNEGDSILHSDLVEGLESTLVILNNQVSKIQIKKDYNGPVLIDCYPGKLNQVFLNILSNAIHAIQSKFDEKLGGEIRIHLEEKAEFVNLTFSDNGIGMDEDTVKKIFEPFFTTKAVGKGTGLGMSIVFKTIEMHKGKISVQSKLGEETTIQIQLLKSLI